MDMTDVERKDGIVYSYFFFQAEDGIRDQPRSRGLEEGIPVRHDCEGELRRRQPDDDQ